MFSLFRFVVSFVLAVTALVVPVRPAGAQAAGVLKVGVIDVEQILKGSTPGKAVIAALEKLRGEKAAQLQTIKDKFDDAQRRLNDGRLTLSEDRLRQMEKELEDLQIDLKRATDDAQRDLQKKQQDEFQRVESAVMPIITQVGRELGYTLIFNKFDSGLVFADEASDITTLVIERYNAVAGGGS